MLRILIFYTIHLPYILKIVLERASERSRSPFFVLVAWVPRTAPLEKGLRCSYRMTSIEIDDPLYIAFTLDGSVYLVYVRKDERNTVSGRRKGEKRKRRDDDARAM